MRAIDAATGALPALDGCVSISNKAAGSAAAAWAAGGDGGSDGGMPRGPPSPPRC